MLQCSEAYHFVALIKMVFVVLSSLSSYPWSTGEDGREIEERSRSISWSGQVGSSTLDINVDILLTVYFTFVLILWEKWVVRQNVFP